MYGTDCWTSAITMHFQAKEHQRTALLRGDPYQYHILWEYADPPPTIEEAREIYRWGKPKDKDLP